MRIKTFVVGDLSTNCYALYDRENKSGIIVDPGDEPEKMIEFFQTHGYSCPYVIITHCHPDHVMGVHMIRQVLRSKVCMSEKEVNFFNVKVDHLLKEGEKIEQDKIKLKVMETPGHTPGSICLIGDKFILSGDTLFNQGVGRTDFPGGSFEVLQDSLKKLLALPKDMIVYPGHGETTTIANEKDMNPYIR